MARHVHAHDPSEQLRALLDPHEKISAAQVHRATEKEADQLSKDTRKLKITRQNFDRACKAAYAIEDRERKKANRLYDTSIEAAEKEYDKVTTAADKKRDKILGFIEKRYHQQERDIVNERERSIRPFRKRLDKLMGEAPF